MDISKWAFHNRNLIYFLIAVLMFGGAYSCYQMSKPVSYTHLTLPTNREV